MAYLALLLEVSGLLLTLLLLTLALLEQSLWDENVVLGRDRTVAEKTCQNRGCFVFYLPSRELQHSGILGWRRLDNEYPIDKAYGSREVDSFKSTFGHRTPRP